MAKDDCRSGIEDYVTEGLTVSYEVLSTENSTLIVQLVGYIDSYNANDFQRAMARATAFGCSNIVLRAEALSYVSSTGIGSMAQFLKIIRGHKLAVVGLQTKVHEILSLLGLLAFIPAMETLDDALLYFQTGNRPTRIVICPQCGARTRFVRFGRFRCPSCRGVIDVSTDGSATSVPDHK